MFPRIEGDAFVGVQGAAINQGDLILLLIVLLIVGVTVWIVRSFRH